MKAPCPPGFHGLLAAMVLATAAGAGMTAALRLVLEPGYFDLRKLEIRVKGTFAS